MIIRFLDFIGRQFIDICRSLGSFALFLVKTITTFFTTKLKVSKLFAQMERIGVSSLSVVILTGLSTGMALALQTYFGFKRVGGEQFIGSIVALGMIRELGPVLTGLMVAGRAGSAITAEIGTMRITEQIDALKTLRINTYQYLVVPRMLAGTFILPFLVLFTMIFGIVGGYVVCVYVLGLSPEDYITSIQQYVEMNDVKGGLIKSGFFGLILCWVGAYKGYRTTGGARGVGKSTTSSVVTASILILIANYFLTKMLENI
ncbi:ABC transporter permease [bacterium]|nr:ABC transporter permease [bacterium]